MFRLASGLICKLKCDQKKSLLLKISGEGR